MNRFEIRLSAGAARHLRELPLFDRQELWDLLEDFRLGRLLEEDFGEVAEDGRLQSTVIVGSTAIRFLVDRRRRIVFVYDFRPADR